MPPLRELQQAFFHALTSGAAGATAVPPALLATVASDATLDAAARVDVYAQMYWMRIVDALHEDFPRVTAVVGHDAFHALARAYLACTPSRQPSLRHVGAGFADFLAARAPADVPSFVADLARLEWARLEVFDAPDTAVLTLDQLRAVPASEWADLRLHVVAAFRILELAWPAHEMWAAEDDVATRSWQPAPTCLRIWRDDRDVGGALASRFRVYQAPLDAAERSALAALAEGASFGEMCAALASVAEPGRAAETAGALLLRWVEDHLLAAVDPTHAPHP